MPRVWRSTDRVWQPLVPGVESTDLHRHPDGGGAALFRMRAGATIPLHDHVVGEHTYVIEGELEFGGTRMGAGDALWTSPGETHVVRAITDATFLGVAPPKAATRRAPSGYEIGRARVHELDELPRIENDAAVIFPREDLVEESDVGLSPAFFLEAAVDGRLWVARELATSEVVGFAATIVVDGEGHLREMDVLPAHGRRGIGRALLDRAVQWARARGHARLTLTTFAHLAWNAPFYRSAGFVAIAPSEMGRELHAIVDAEARRGLRNRIAMALDVIDAPRWPALTAR